MMKNIIAGILAFSACTSVVSAANYLGCTGDNLKECCDLKQQNGWNEKTKKVCSRNGCNKNSCDDYSGKNMYTRGSNYNDDDNKWGSASNYQDDDDDYSYNKHDEYNYNNLRYEDNFVKDVVYKSSGYSSPMDYEIYTQDGHRAGYSLDGWENDGYWGPKIHQVRESCAVAFYKDLTYLAKAIRLVFHDCMGQGPYGCDGCVDLSDPDNFGLDGIMYLLLDVWRDYRHWFSRVDVWNICALTALDISSSMYEPNAPAYKMTFVGKKDCVNANEMGDGGDKLKMYPDYINSRSLQKHFYDYFGFDARCTTAVMGTHGMSQMHPWNSGHGDGSYPAKWAQGTSYILDNWYFKGFKFPWTYEIRPNFEYPYIGEKKQWYWETDHQTMIWNGDGYEEGKLVMLDSDMSLKYDYSNYQDSNGYVYCKASYEAKHHGPSSSLTVPVCPTAYDTYDIVEEYAHDNLKFLYDVEYCMVKMFNTGYRHGMDGNYQQYYGHGAYY